MAGKTTNSVTGSPPAALVSSLRRLLYPLARLLLAKGVTYPAMIDLLKSVFVDVADKEFRLADKEQTDSRISLISGVHRKDVKRLRHESRAIEATPTAVSLGAQLVAHWISTPRYLDESGRPVPLPRLESEGGEVSFEALVKSVSTDIRSRAVLDEWLRLGVATLDDEDRVCLRTEAFVPNEGFDEKAFYFGQNISDHIAAGVHNLLEGDPPFLDRSVYYDELSQEAADELNGLARELGMQALQTLNRRAIELQNSGIKITDTSQRINFGVYFFNTEVRKAADEDDNT